MIFLFELNYSLIQDDVFHQRFYVPLEVVRDHRIDSKEIIVRINVQESKYLVEDYSSEKENIR